MKKEIKLEAMPKAVGGYVNLCGYCGEGIGVGQKLCPTCKTKAGREDILKKNQKILAEGRKQGHFLERVFLPVA